MRHGWHACGLTSVPARRLSGRAAGGCRMGLRAGRRNRADRRTMQAAPIGLGGMACCGGGSGASAGLERQQPPKFTHYSSQVIAILKALQGSWEAKAAVTAPNRGPCRRQPSPKKTQGWVACRRCSAATWGQPLPLRCCCTCCCCHCTLGWGAGHTAGRHPQLAEQAKVITQEVACIGGKSVGWQDLTSGPDGSV